jgi:hypothetical protein
MVAVDELQSLLMGRQRGRGELREQRQDLGSTAQLSKRQLADHERVGQHLGALEQLREHPVTALQVLDPDRGVDNRQRSGRARHPRLLRARLRPGSLPPSAAKRRALSRAISACSPACSTAVLSRIPLRRLAWASNPSSMLSVVLMLISLHVRCKSRQARPSEA